MLTCAGSQSRESIQSQAQRLGWLCDLHLVQNKPWALSGSRGNGESTKVVQVQALEDATRESESGLSPVSNRDEDACK